MTVYSTIAIAIMFLAGLMLSAFFSGTETGFYRVARLRLAMDDRAGDRVSKGLFWLACRPPLFVATALIGNNLANYVTSLSILLATRAATNGHTVAEFCVPILVAPIVFIYGELLPKNLFFLAPNRLLKRGGSLFLLFFALFYPFSILLALLGRLLQAILGESPQAIRLRLARAEINQLLDEGKEVGILRPAQRQLAQAVSEISQQPVTRLVTPLHRVPCVNEADSIDLLLQVAKRTSASVLLVTHRNTRKPCGYISTANFASEETDWNDQVRPLPTIDHTETHLGALIAMQTGRHTLAQVIDLQTRTVGYVSLARLKEPLVED